MVRRVCWFAAVLGAPALFGCSDGSSGAVGLAPPPDSCRDFRPPPPTVVPAVRPDLLIQISDGHEGVGDGAGGVWVLERPADKSDRQLVRIDAAGSRTEQALGLPQHAHLAAGETATPWIYFDVSGPLTVGGRMLSSFETPTVVLRVGPAGITVPPIPLRCRPPSPGTSCYLTSPSITAATHLRDGVALVVGARGPFEIAATEVATSAETSSAVVVLDSTGVVRATRVVGADLDPQGLAAHDDGRLTVWGWNAARQLVIESYPPALDLAVRHQLGDQIGDLRAAPGPGGTLWFAGVFMETARVGSRSVTASHGSRDIAVLGVRPASGEVLELFALGGPGHDDVTDLKVDARGRLWLAGTAIRRLGLGDDELDLGTAHLGPRAFIARLDGPRLGALAVVSQAGMNSTPDVIPIAVFPVADDRAWLLASSTLLRPGADPATAGTPWAQLGRVALGAGWKPRPAAGPPLSDPAARPLGLEELALAHPDELHAAGGALVVGGVFPLAAAVLARTGDRWQTTATIPGPVTECSVNSQLATDGQVLVRTTRPTTSFCKDESVLGFQMHERGPDGQFRPVTLPRADQRHEEEWFEGAAVSGGLLALSSDWSSWSGGYQVELFRRGPDGWRAIQVLEPPGGCPNIFNECWGGFGQRMLLDEKRLLLGAHQADDPRPESGKIVVYQAGQDGFAVSQTVGASDAAPDKVHMVYGGEGSVSWLHERGEGFGHTLAAAGGLVATVPSNKDAIYFLGGSGTLSERGQLPLVTLEGGEPFPHALALTADFLVVGNPFESHDGVDSAGVVYIFRRQGDGWRRLGALTLTDAWRSAYLGSGVAIHDGRWLLVSAPRQGPGGAVYELDLARLDREARPDPWVCH